MYCFCELKFTAWKFHTPHVTNLVAFLHTIRSVHFLEKDYLQLQGHGGFCERTLVNEGWLEEPMKDMYNVHNILTSFSSN